MSQNGKKEKWKDCIIAILGVGIITACCHQVPTAMKKEAAFKAERQEVFLADAKDGAK